MILDQNLEFASNITIPTAVGVGNLGDVLDMRSGGRYLGAGNPMYVVFQIDTAVTSGGSATVSFQIVSDSTETIATNGTQTIHGSTGDIAVASLVEGYSTALMLPPKGPYKRYLGIQAVVGTTTLTAGTASAFMTLQLDNYHTPDDAIK